MLVTAVVLASVLASASGFALNGKTLPYNRMAIKMAEPEAWNAVAYTTNTVSMEQLGSAYTKATSSTQDFLEADPYWDTSNMPMQLFKAKEPLVGKIISVKRIVGAAATGETCDVIIDHFGKMPYWEGQSYGVIPPGINPKNEKPFTNRLYSIASTRYGDDMKGTTTTLCVRRATYWDAEMGKDDPAKKGVCSNFLCDAKPGDDISLTGPSGKVMLMPEAKPEADIIMVATGTGIAPYRSFLRRLFVEETKAGAAFKGLAWLFLGVANTDALLYDEDWQKIKEKFPDNFRLDYALSREQNNRAGGKMYIQDKVEEYSDEIFNRMNGGAHMYFCGLKGMMPGILTMLEGVSSAKGLVWADKLKEWKAAGQWHVEVY
jgi:ferredoxin--NADP+ reductase